MKINEKLLTLMGVILMIVFTPVNINASTGLNEIAEADSAYSHGDYEKTIALYNSFIKSNGANAAILYNLGNAYYKSGNEGEARLCLERAKRLDPSGHKINENLNYLTSRIQDANKSEMKGKRGSVAPDPKGYFGRLHDSIAVDTSSDSWAEMAAMAFLLTILAVALYLFSANVKLKKAGFFSAIILICFSVIFIIFAEMAAKEFYRKNECLLMTFKATLMAEPGDSDKPIGFPLHRGTKFQILDSRLNADGEIGWYKVKLNSSNIGWLPAADVTII